MANMHTPPPYNDLTPTTPPYRHMVLILLTSTFFTPSAELVADKNRRSVRRGEAAQAAARLALDLALGTAAYLAWLCWGPGGGGA